MSAATNRLRGAALEAFALKVPKTELHLHLDGSLSPEFIFKRALVRGVKLDVSEPSQLRPFLQQRKATQIAGGNKQEKSGNWGIFDFCNQFLQSKEELREATADILMRLDMQAVKLCEIRFCPSLHVLEGLSEREAVAAVLKGFSEAQKKTGIEGGVIVCALRSYPAKHSTDMAELAKEFIGETPGVVGFDIAGDEGNYPLLGMMGGVKRAKELGVPVTVHAGEWPVNEKFGTASVDNLRCALDSKCVDRIGHGIQLQRDQQLLDDCLTAGIFVECCLTSNVGRKVPSYREHPIKDLLRHGVKVTLNCDNLLLSGTLENEAQPKNEILHFMSDLEMSVEDLKQVLYNGADASFTFFNRPTSEADSWKASFRNQVDSAIAECVGQGNE